VLVGRGGSDHRVDHEQHHVGQVDRDLRLHRDRAVDATRIGLPAAGVDQREATVAPLGLVGHAVAGHARCVLHDGLTASEDAVHERGLADVRASDDRHHGQSRAVVDAVLAERDTGEERGVLVVQLVVGEAGAQGLRALLGEILVEQVHLLGELVGAAFVFVVSHGVLLGFARSP